MTVPIRTAHATIEAMLTDYRGDLDFGHPDGWWSRRTYTTEGDVSVLLRPMTTKGDPGGPLQYGSLIMVSLGELTLERQTARALPAPEILQETIDALMQRITSDGKDNAARLLEELRTLTSERDRIAGEIKITVVEAVTVGARKLAVSDVTGIARSTIDRWLAEK